jgi:CO/xanthine dehydrogenase FAD-binding subunit
MMLVFFRRMPRMDYLRPQSLAEALAAIDPNVPTKHQVYAGGTDLLLKLRSREVKAPPCLIDLKGIRDLDYVTWDLADGLRIGAVASIATVGHAPAVKEKFPALEQGVTVMASDQIQNRGTIVGNVCNAVPSADSIPALLVHDARVVCVGRSGERIVALKDFFLAPGEVALKPGELVKELWLPPPHARERNTYLKLAPRGRMDLAVVGAAASVVVEDGVTRIARIGLGSAGPVPVLAKEAEETLLGRPLDVKTIEQAARIAAQQSRTRSSHRASGEYRQMMIEVLVRRALTSIAA